MRHLLTLHLESPVLINNLLSGDRNNFSQTYFDIQKDVKVSQNISIVWLSFFFIYNNKLIFQMESELGQD